MHGLCALLVGKGIYSDSVRYHEGGIETKSEMTYDLILGGLVLVFFEEVGSA